LTQLHPDDILDHKFTNLGVDLMSFQSQAKKHWTKFLPERTADLKKRGLFEKETKEAAEAAKAELAVLVRNGAQIALARVLLLKPRFIFADEPTSRLDLSVQAHVIRLIAEMVDQ